MTEEIKDNKVNQNTEKLMGKKDQFLCCAVYVPQGAKDVEGNEKGYGFIKISRETLESYPEILGEKRLTPEENNQWTESVFVHITSVDGINRGQNLDGVEIVPLSIKFVPDKRKWQVARALTKEEHLKKLESERARKEAQKREDEKKKKERELDEKQTISCLERIKELYPDLSEELLESCAREAAELKRIQDNNGEWRNATLEDKHKRAESNAEYEMKKKEFDENQERYNEEAKKIAERFDAEVEESEFGHCIDVVIRIPEEKFVEWQKAYSEVLRIDLWLVEQGLLAQETNKKRDSLYLGRFSNAKIGLHGHFSEGDMFNTRGGYAVSFYAADEEPERPYSGTIIWSRDCTKGLVDNTANAEEERTRLYSQEKWPEILEIAKLYKQDILDAKEKLKSEKEEAVSFITTLIKKITPKKARLGEEEGTWIGLKTNSYSLHKHTGQPGGNYIEYHCEVEIPGWGYLDLEHPGGWSLESGDIREAAKIVRKIWEKSQPEGAVILGETKEEAISRLENFPWNEDALPEIEGMKWKVNYLEVKAYANPDDESLIPEMPKIQGEWDEEQEYYHTHHLVLTGKGLENKIIGSIIIRKGRIDPGYIGELIGVSSDTIRLFFKEHPDLDPRLIKTCWRQVIPHS